MLQGLDIAVVFSLAMYERQRGDWSAAAVRHELGIPRATLSKSIERLRHARLVRESFLNRAMLSTMLPVLPSLVPAAPLSQVPVRGLASGAAAPAFGGLFRAPVGLVWALDGGPDEGLPIEPLHPRIPRSVAEGENPAQYALLAYLDAVRGGRAREMAHGAEGLRLLCGLPPVPGMRPGESVRSLMGELASKADESLALAG